MLLCLQCILTHHIQYDKYKITHTNNNITTQFKAEPLVPIGCLTTAFFLGSGIKSFYNRDPKKSQTMMRLRVGSQFATLLIFIGYAGMNAFTLELAPGMAVPSEQIPGGSVARGSSSRSSGKDDGEN